VTSHLTSRNSPKAGSNAGRGFRYQDLVGSLFVTRMYLGEAGFGLVVPEGSDDYEIRTANGLILVDTKSNRAEARLRSENNDVASLQKLWTRPLPPGAQISEYWLVTERSRGDSLGAGKYTAQDLFYKDVPIHSERSFILIEPDPLQKATELLATQRGITPLAAELVAIAFARAVGELASNNGPLRLEQRKAITPSDAERIAARVLAAVDAYRLEALLRSGFVIPVDFVTPLEDTGFYLGVDVQPGHFAAGLAVERPDQAARIVEAINRTGVVVVRGPSGAGKSSLMWNAVLAARTARRWFKVNASVGADPEELASFFEAYKNIAVGFVVDDIGRTGVEAWKALRLHCRAHTQAVMIGSIRSEDAALLPARHLIAEIDASADSQLASTLWARLRERDQTKWPGWIEPWKQSRGLLLEYVHILTAGAQLDAVILDQVRTRIEQKRDHEIEILSASALAAAHGGSVSVATLRERLSLSAAEMVRALERLITEHLVRIDVYGAKLAGLHSLRAISIATALAEVGYSTLAEQANEAIAVTHAVSLDKVISGLILSGAISEAAAAEAVTARFAGKVALSEVAAAIRGLRVGALTLASRNWIAVLPVAGIPRKLATAAALMGLAGPTNMPDIGDMRKLVEYGNRLHSSTATLRFPSALASALIRSLRESGNPSDVADYIDALSALSRAPLTADQREEISALPLRFDSLSITDVTGILDAAESIDPTIASAWVERAEHADLLFRLSAETPFALPITREVTDDGLVVHGDIYEAAVQSGGNSNDLLVAHVNSIMRLEPATMCAHVRLVDINSEKSLHLDSEKRIARRNAIPKVLAQSNRLVLDIVAAEVASESWSHYLMSGEQLLRRGLNAFRILLDSVMVGRINQQALERLNEVITACDNMIAPVDPPESNVDKAAAISGRHLTPLQNLVWHSNAVLVRRVVQLPEGASALAAHVKNLIKQADEAKNEPWPLVRDGAPEELDQLQETLRKIELLALEAAASKANPRQRWPKADGKPKGAFDLIASRSHKALLQRIRARSMELLKMVACELPSAEINEPKLQDGILWQSRFVATFVVATFADFENWISEAREIGGRLRAQVDEGEDIILIPLINGYAAVDYTYQLSRGDPHSIVSPILIAIGQTSLLSAPDQSIVNKLDAPVIRHPIQLEPVFIALRNLIGMHVLGLGGPERPADEREIFDIASSELATKWPDLLEIIDCLDHPTVDALKEFIAFFLPGTESKAIVPSISSVEIQNMLAELTWRRSQTPH
jgi:hypothetical protein